ncbi:unnamed protein product [Lymnaea stagnalis]|uniref:Uncharacterized protein n=1 Tax=Lymnaea stagnalis TaxID=6523 RepID=A0AAV2I7F1_LYMST
MKSFSYAALIILIIGGVSKDMLSAQEIPIFNLTQNECTTQCSSGLLKLLETCRFHLLVGFDKDITSSSTLLFEIKKASNDIFLPLFNLQLQSDCTGYKENAVYYCTQTDSRHFEIVINAEDLSRFNDAQMRAYLTASGENKIYSVVQRFPQFYDQTKAKGILKINGQSASSDSVCSQVINVTHVIIEFQCVSAATPCLIELKVNEIVVNQSKDHAVFSHNYTKEEELNVAIKYAACSLVQEHDTIHCKIKTGVRYKEDTLVFKLSQHKCETKCRDDLYINTCIFYFNLNFYKAVSNTSFLFVELRGPSDNVYKPLFNVDLHSECAQHKENAQYSCTRIDISSFGITIAPRELEQFREAKIRAYSKLSQHDTIYSEPLNFPPFFEETHETAKLKVNGQDMPSTSNNCNITTKDNDVVLEFHCLSSAKPCLIDIQVDDYAVIKHQENYAVYKGHYASGVHLTVNIKYGACGFRGGYKNIVCKVTIATAIGNSFASEQPEWLIPVIASVVSAVIIIIVAGIVLFCCYIKGFRMCSEDASASLNQNEVLTQSMVLLAGTTRDDTIA